MKIHPSENPEPWINLAKSMDNLNVIEHGSLIGLIKACDVLIHCGSSSAVEAYMSDKPVISYCLDSMQDEYLLEVPTFMSRHLTNQEEVLALLSDILSGRKSFKDVIDTDKAEKYISKLIFNFGNGAKFSEILMLGK